MSEHSHTNELEEITDYLEEKEINKGYATFWNANILTELSDEYIDVYCFLDNGKDRNRIQVYEWLQLVSHIEENPSGELFLLLTKDEYELFPWKECLDEKETDYETNGFLCIYLKIMKNLPVTWKTFEMRKDSNGEKVINCMWTRDNLREK